MKWTFGLITSSNPDYLRDAITSIRVNGPPLHAAEIILVGGKRDYDGIDLWIPFDETIKDGWITKKKNLVANAASNPLVCLMHDYVSLSPGWWDGVQADDEPWLTCMHRVVNQDGSRFRDWCMISNDSWMDPPIDSQTPPNGAGRLLKYDNNEWGRWQYYSGAYFCARRDVLRELPLDENRGWGQGEDVQWCRWLYQKYGQHGFHMNPKASVQFLKQKPPAPWESREPL